MPYSEQPEQQGQNQEEDTEKKLEALEKAQEDVVKAFERGDLLGGVSL